MADLPNRRSIRMRGYDYANEGAYFLTICTHERQHLFGRITDGVMAPNALGAIAQRCWDAIPQHMPHVDVGEFVVMPNHVHGIVIIRERHPGRDPVGADHDRPGIPTDHDRPDIATDHDRPNTPPPSGTPNAGNDAPDDPTANTPRAQMRADPDRPLRPPADPGARPPTPMPIVPVGSLGRIVRAFKSAVTRMAYRDGLLPHGTPVWQRNYWDRVIRDDGAYERIAKYIRDNPANWKGDRFNR